MPQASDAEHQLMEHYFGDAVSDSGPIKYLESQGYTLTQQWTWEKAGITTYEQMTEKEFNCLAFLIHEWDFGGLTHLT